MPIEQRPSYFLLVRKGDGPPRVVGPLSTDKGFADRAAQAHREAGFRVIVVRARSKRDVMRRAS